LTKKEHFDVLILGGGPAGCTAAIIAKRKNPKLSIGIIEKNNILCRKLLVCGAGRCNITNTHVIKDKYSGANNRFLGNIFNAFGTEDIYSYLDSLGITIYEEVKGNIARGKVFPITNDSKTVIELITHEVENLGIHKLLSTEILSANNKEGDFLIKTSEGTYSATKLVNTLGGIAYPALGASSLGYDIANKFGHTVISPIPSAVPLVVDDWISKRLSGLKFIVGVQVYIGNDLIKEVIDDLLFTSYGVSGSAILDVSRIVSDGLNRQKLSSVRILVNLFRNQNYDQVYNLLESRWQSKPNDTLKFSLYGLLPNKFVNVFLDYMRLDPNIVNKKLINEDKRRLVSALVNWEMQITGTRDWDQAEFSAGGIKVSEIRSQTMESKIVPKLYLGGEVVDVDGDIGGFNLSWAWISGMIIGNSLALDN